MFNKKSNKNFEKKWCKNKYITFILMEKKE